MNQFLIPFPSRRPIYLTWIFRLIGEGLTSGAIADRLFISTHTIDTHRENIKRKLDITTAAELSRAAVQWLLENC